MNDNGQEFTGLNYEMLVEDSLRMVVRSALRITEMSGLPGETHFYIAFRTDFNGVMMDDALRADHPETITIVIQHQFSDLLVEDDQFTITLFFAGRPSTMTVPFAAITSFNDPSVGFGLQFEMPDADQDQDAENSGAVDNEEAGDSAETSSDANKAESAEVVSLDSFRKTPS